MKSIAKALMVIAAAAAASACTNGPKDGEYQLDLLTTNDVHGSWFDSTYVGGPVKTSLMAVNSYVTQFRDSLGKDNVLLIDAGDCLQGDNAAYYMQQIPGMRAVFLAGRRECENLPVHNPGFDIDESVMLDAMNFLYYFCTENSDHSI